ncbi:MAG: hypothetical protein ACRDGT_10095 [Candidatus Limnocylindria bacterium]
MQRVSVIGSSSGAGKTIFGRRLAARLALPFIELDAIHWGPGWSALSPEPFREQVLKALPADGWVVDGNYGKLGGLVWDSADTLIWLDIPLHVALWRILTRTLRRIRTGEDLWPGTGNRETIRNAFFARDSLLLYAVRTYRRRKRRWEEYARTGKWAHLTLHRFPSNAEADSWLASL